MIATLRQGVVRAREQLVQKEAEFTRANARLAEVSRQIWPSHMLACMHPDCRVYDLSICESMYMDRSASIT